MVRNGADRAAPPLADLLSSVKGGDGLRFRHQLGKTLPGSGADGKTTPDTDRPD